jgi:hypothetical protein
MCTQVGTLLYTCTQVGTILDKNLERCKHAVCHGYIRRPHYTGTQRERRHTHIKVIED